jgi:hypothetical protein
MTMIVHYQTKKDLRPAVMDTSRRQRTHPRLILGDAYQGRTETSTDLSASVPIRGGGRDILGVASPCKMGGFTKVACIPLKYGRIVSSGRLARLAYLVDTP